MEEIATGKLQPCGNHLYGDIWFMDAMTCGTHKLDRKVNGHISTLSSELLIVLLLRENV